MAESASAQVSAAVQAAMVPAARYVALVVQNAPHRTVDWLTDRPDVSATLENALSEARRSAAAIVTVAWGDAPPSPVLEHLLADITRQYAALSHLRGLIRHAHAAAERPARPAAVRRAITGWARTAALRSRMTAAVAETAAASARVLAEGKTRKASGEAVSKRWLARADGKACHWCAGLHGVTIGLDESFLPYLGGPADLTGHGRLTQPPHPYRGELQFPPLHPYCRCRIAIVTEVSAAEVTLPAPGARPAFTARQIRAMPEGRYRSLIAFLDAALHELGQVLRRLVSRA